MNPDHDSSQSRPSDGVALTPGGALACVELVARILVEIGRLTALTAMRVPVLGLKEQETRRSFDWIRYGRDAARFAQEFLAPREFVFCWSDQTRDLLSDPKKVGSNDQLLERVDELRSDYSRAISLLKKHAESSGAAAHLSALVAQLPPPDRFFADMPSSNWSSVGAVNRCVRGPIAPVLDAVFEPQAQSALDVQSKRFGSSLREAVPYFWSVSAKESGTSDLCLLCMFEYDGLPVSFYYDMAKQAWDEARHANVFIALAQALLPEFNSMLSVEDPLRPIIARILRSGSGYPVWAEGTFYESFWTASLEQRLVIMHLDTEAPSLPEFKRRLATSFAAKYDEVGSALKWIMTDESTHAAIGARWLEFLIPDPSERQNAISDARLLRGFLLTVTTAAKKAKGLRQLVNELVLK